MTICCSSSTTTGITSLWDGTEWVQVEEGTLLPVSGREQYQVALLGGGGVLQGGPPENSGCAGVRDVPGVPLADGAALSTTVADGPDGERVVQGVAISAPWELNPRSVVAGEANSDLEHQAVEILAARDFATDSVRILQTVKADLDGDGAIETLVVVEETALAHEMSDVYALVFAVSPAWQDPRVVEASVISSEDSGFPASFRISAWAT